MNRKKQFGLLLSLIIFMVLVVCGATIGLLYNISFESTEERLTEIVHNQASFIESVAIFSKDHLTDYAGGWEQAALTEIIYAHENFDGFGETGEFTLARLDGDMMVFLLNHRFQSTDIPQPVPFNAELAEPMRRSLSGKSGLVIGPDYRGETVLAAYEPVNVLNYGVVAKIDLSEVRRPYIVASIIALGSTLLLGLITSIIFIKVTSPVLKQLESSELMIRSTFELAAVSIIHFDFESNILLANKGFGKLTGYTDSDLMKIKLPDLFCNGIENLPEVVSYKSETKGSVPYEKNMELVTRQGDKIWVNTHISLVSDYKKLPKYFIAIMVDINEKVRIEKELQRYTENLEDIVKERTKKLEEIQGKMLKQEKLAALGQLAGSLGHELRNPLGVMTNAIYLLLIKHESSDEKTKEYLTIIDRQIKLSNKIITDLLEFSRIHKATRAQFDIRNIIEEILSSSNTEGLIIDKYLDSEGIKLWADIDHVRIILQNIIGNAIQAMGGTGNLEITGRSNDDRIIISIKDNGCGMDEDTVRQIFDPLFTTKERGIGLGLSICKNLAEINDIELSVESVPEKGTTFFVEIPKEGEHEEIT